MPNLQSSVFRILYLLSFLGLVLLSLPPDASTLHYRWPWIGIFQVAIGVAIVAAFIALVYSWQTPVGRFNGFTIGGSLLLTGFILSSLFTRYPERAVFSLMIPAGALSLGYLTYYLLSNAKDIDTLLILLLRGVVVSTFLICSHSLWLWVTSDYFTQQNSFGLVNEQVGERLLSASLISVRNPHPFGHVNYTAGFAILVLPIVAALSLTERKRWRYFCWIVMSIALLTLISSRSRAGIGVGLAMLMGAVLLGLYEKKASRIWFLSFSIGLLFMAGTSTLLVPRIRDTLFRLLQGSGLSFADLDRLSLIQTALRIGADSPFWGQGAGTVSIYFPKFWEGTGRLFTAYQVHCAPPQIWAEIGIIGLLGIAVISVSVLRSWFRLARHASTKGSRTLRPLWHGLGISFAGYSLFSLTDYQLEVYYISGLLAMIAGIFAALRLHYFDDERTHRSRGKPFILIVFLIAAGFSIFFAYKQFSIWQSRRWFQRGQTALSAGDTKDYQHALTRAAKWSPTDAFYPHQLALGLMRLRNQTDEGTNAEVPYEKIASSLEEALAIEPWQLSSHYNLGWLNLNLDPDSAVRYFRAAAETAPKKWGVYFGLALALKKTGQTERAIRSLALECFSQPDFNTLPLWEDEKFKSVKPQVGEHLWRYYSRAESYGEFYPAHRVLFDEAYAITRWWWGYPLNTRRLSDENRKSFELFLSKIESRSHPASTDRQEAELIRPPLLAFYGWLGDGDARKYLNAASVMNYGTRADPSRIDALTRAFSDKAEPFASLLRTANQSPIIPRIPYQNRFPAFGLLSRNLDGPVPLDLFFYEKNMLLDLALSPLIPRTGYLPGALLREFLREL